MPKDEGTRTVDSAGDPAAGNGGFDWSKVPDDATFELDVHGQKIQVKGRQKAKDIMQLGYRYSERAEELNKRERDLEEAGRRQSAELAKRYEAHENFAQFLESNPEIKRKVKLVINNEAEVVPLDEMPPANGNAPPAHAPGNKMEMMRLRDEMTQQFGNFQSQVLGRLDEITRTTGTLRQDSEHQSAVNKIRSNPRYSKLATDDRIAVAKEHARKTGMDLESAFKVTAFDELPGMVEAATIERFGINPESFELPASSPPVIGGVKLDDETMSKLFDNPDEYAKVRDAIREHRRKKSGKGEAVRSGRR